MEGPAFVGANPSDLRVAVLGLYEDGEVCDEPSVLVTLRNPAARQQLEWVQSVIEQGHPMGPVSQMLVYLKGVETRWLWDNNPAHAELRSGFIELERNTDGGLIMPVDFELANTTPIDMLRILNNTGQYEISSPMMLPVLARAYVVASDPDRRPSGLTFEVNTDDDGASRTNMFTFDQFAAWLCD